MKLGRAGCSCAIGVGFALLLAQGARADRLEEAEVAFRNGERARAGALVREYVRERPEAERSARVAALLARTARDPAEALGRWEEVLALEPRGPLAAEAHWMKGMHAYSAGRYVSASREFALLAEEFAGRFDRARALLWKGYAELGSDRAREALESLRAAEREATDPFDASSAELGQAHASFRLGNVRDALRRYRRFERRHPADGRASAAAHRMAECLRLLGRNEEADRVVQRIGRDYPESFEATLARAEFQRPAPAREGGLRPGSSEEKVAPPPRGPFIVQVAAMADPRNAAALRRGILALGITQIRIQPVEGPEGLVHRVLLGPFDTEEEARAMADSVAALGDLTPRVREASPH